MSTHSPWHANHTITPGNDEIDVPLLTLAAERDETTLWPDIAALHASVGTEPSYIGLFPAGGHYSFVPGACLVLGDGDGCGPGFLSPEDAAGLIIRATYSFLQEARGESDQSPTTIFSRELVWEPASPEPVSTRE